MSAAAKRRRGGVERQLLMAALLLAATGCAGGIPRPRYPLTDAKLALARREATIAGLKAMRAEARVDQRAKQGRIRGTVLMFVEQSGRVRFDVMTQFGPVAILTSDGHQFAYADFREKRYLVGETCPKNIARLLGVPLSAADTARFLLGGTPVLDEISASELKLTDDGFYRVTLSSPNGQKQELDLAVYPADRELPAEQQRLYLLRSELIGPSGARIWRVSYDDVEALSKAPDALLMPRRVRVEQPASSSDTLVQFKEIAVNPSIPDERFVQTPRAGMLEEVALCDDESELPPADPPPAEASPPEPAPAQP